MKRLIISLLFFAGFLSSVSAQRVTVRNPYAWTDLPDPDIIRVDDYYYLVTTTMHLFPGAPVMRSCDLLNWQTVSYLFDEIHDTPRYDMQGGTVYGKGQWATSLRCHNGTFWALFVADDEPHQSMLFRTDDPAKGWTLHSRLPAFHDSSLFFDDDGRVYVFFGVGDMRLVELNSDLTGVKEGGVNKVLELHGKPDGLHEGSRVIKHDGMYYLLCISWPRTGRQEICYRSKNIEGPYESRVILKSEFGGFPYAGQGTVVDGKNGEWYGVIFQDRGGVGRVLTIEPCRWIDGWPMLGNDGDGKIPAEVSVCTDDPALNGKIFDGANIEKDYQWNHNFIRKDIQTETGSITHPGRWVSLKTSTLAHSLFDARNTMTWRMWGPQCSDTVVIDARKLKDGDRAGLAAFNGQSGIMTVCREDNQYFLTITDELVNMSGRSKTIVDVTTKELARIPLRKSQLRDIRLAVQGDFRPGRDIATFHYSIDGGKSWHQDGGEFHMHFDISRFFMGTRYALFHYATKETGGITKFNIH